jgi:hypothetical protein
MNDETQKKLRAFLKDHGLKLQYIADQVGMTPSLLRYYLDGSKLSPELEEQIRTKLREHSRKVYQAVRGKKRRFE